MSLSLKATQSTAREGVGLDDWFAALGDEYIGRVSLDSLRAGMVEGWRLRWRGRELQLQVNEDFPFSVPRVFLVGHSRAQAEPHVENDGKLCLTTKAVPGERIRSVQAALADAFQLLTENETKQHEEDFREDFGLYWLNWASATGLRAEFLPGREGAVRSKLVLAVQTKDQVFVLPNKAEATKFWENCTGAAPKSPKTAALIPIAPLPAPERYPDSAAELWAMVDARSQDGTDLLARLVDRDPKEAFVVLAGIAPSGRDHYAALRVSRPVDRAGLPLKRRALRQGIERSKDPLRALFERFKIERLATGRLDASSSRLPEGVHREIADAKVLIVGCGALGSGVARMLAQAGVEHLRLVDPEMLGWENIRRHELGGGQVGSRKATSLAHSIRTALPTIGFVQGYAMTFASFAREHPDALRETDVVVCCTGHWTADASVEYAFSKPDHNASVVYGWMESHALASHAVVISDTAARFADGFDEHGNFRLPVVAGGRPPPAECGGASTPFGAIELAHAQALVSKLAIDVLRGLQTGTAWRSWIADLAAFEETEASVGSDWISARGLPSNMGGLLAGEWSFP